MSTSSVLFLLLIHYLWFLQLLEPGRYIWLLKALYGLLMLLPQVIPVFFSLLFPVCFCKIMATIFNAVKYIQVGLYCYLTNCFNVRKTRTITCIYGAFRLQIFIIVKVFTI